MIRRQQLSLVVAVAALASGLAGCTGDSGAEATNRQAEGSAWADLRRPLRIPRIKPGARCPVTASISLSPAFAPGQGAGPVYPVGAANGMQFLYPVQPEQGWYPSEWSGNKIAWTAAKSFRGPVLIRGRRLDGTEKLGFGEKPVPAAELRLTVTAAGVGEDGWYQQGSFTRVRAAGCYAWQIDGRAFSRVIVFRAVKIAA